MKVKQSQFSIEQKTLTKRFRTAVASGEESTDNGQPVQTSMFLQFVHFTISGRVKLRKSCNQN